MRNNLKKITGILLVGCVCGIHAVYAQNNDQRTTPSVQNNSPNTQQNTNQPNPRDPVVQPESSQPTRSNNVNNIPPTERGKLDPVYLQNNQVDQDNPQKQINTMKANSPNSQLGAAPTVQPAPRQAVDPGVKQQEGRSADQVNDRTLQQPAVKPVVRDTGAVRKDNVTRDANGNPTRATENPTRTATPAVAPSNQARPVKTPRGEDKNIYLVPDSSIKNKQPK